VIGRLVSLASDQALQHLTSAPPWPTQRQTASPLERKLRPQRQSGEAVLRHGAIVHSRTDFASSAVSTRPASSRSMTRTYQYDTPAGQLKIRQFKGGLWRLWAGDEFLGSFTSAEAAVQALLNGTCSLPLGGRKARIKVPPDLDDWEYVTAP